jgi:hypothetical protein
VTQNAGRALNAVWSADQEHRRVHPFISGDDGPQGEAFVGKLDELHSFSSNPAQRYTAAALSRMLCNIR